MGKAGYQGASVWRRFLLWLPDEIARHNERGQPIHVEFPEPPRESAVKLLEVLGVTWSVRDEESPPVSPRRPRP